MTRPRPSPRGRRWRRSRSSTRARCAGTRSCSGVVVAGLSTRGQHTNLGDLGVSWLIAVGVSFTISLELVVLVARTLGTSLRDMQHATDLVRAGDYRARVPVVATDETGTLAQPFNTMVEGLGERERLREAFGAYVDPGLAERVLREGSR